MTSRTTRTAIVIAGAALAVGAGGVWFLLDDEPAPGRWSAAAVPRSTEPHPVFEAPPDLPALPKSQSEDPREQYGVSDPVVTRDGTVWLLQDRRAAELDNQHLGPLDSYGRSLVALRPDGTVDVARTPYDGRQHQGVRPLCAGPDGTLYAAADGSRLVALSPDGEWRPVTAELVVGEQRRGDGGPAVDAVVNGLQGCTVEADGDLLVAELCAVRRIDPAGVISTVAGRELPGGSTSLWGCGQAAQRESTTPSPGPQLLRGPALANDLPTLRGIAAGPDGRVWFTSPLALRSLDPRPDGSYDITTVQTIQHGDKTGIEWPYGLQSNAFLGDVEPLADGRVLVVAERELWVLDLTDTLRPAAAGSYVGVAVHEQVLYSAGPVAVGGGLRISQVP